MGVFRCSKNPKQMTNAAPELMQNTTDLATNVWAPEEVAAFHSAVGDGTSPASPLVGDFAPIAGVDIAAYGWVSKRIAAYNFDQNLLVGFAAQRGISAEAWQQASAGWAVRMTNPTVAIEFRRHYDAS